MTADAAEKLKQRLAPELSKCLDFVSQEVFLLSFLRARRFDVSKTEAMLRNHLQYRQALGIDSPDYAGDYPISDLMLNFYTIGWFGHDKCDRPVVYFPFGGIDPKGVLNCARHSEILRTIFFYQEMNRFKCLEATKRTGRLVDQVVYILDLKGLSSRHMMKQGLDIFQQISMILEQHTPEILNKCFVINAPSLVYVIYKLVKPILDENTLQKVHIYGSSQWQEKLLELIDKSQLPACYGGEAYGPNDDPKCGHKICHGGVDVPKEMYFHRRYPNGILPNVVVSELTIPRGQHVLLKYHVNTPGSILFWYFHSDSSHDVGFAIYRLGTDEAGVLHDDEQSSSMSSSNGADSSLASSSSSCGGGGGDLPKGHTMGRHNSVDGLQIVQPYFRLSTQLVPEWGHLVANEPASYVIQFDNAYSWLYSKHLKVYISVEEPNSRLLPLLPR